MTRPTLLLHGAFERVSSIALVNRWIVKGLEARGWRVDVSPADGRCSTPPSFPLPDVYLFHGHPYDVTHAPGRVNAFYLPYDYATFTAPDRGLVPRLNGRFDLVIVPSRFSRDACRRSGVTVPLAVCPYGVDSSAFSPHVEPVAVPGRRRFCFLSLGGATERKGTDLLVDAFVREFSTADDVTLVVKAFSYAHLAPWMDRVLARAARRRRAPHLVYRHADDESIAGYYTAADVGVFPFRGEGFGLPVLECLASGRPAIATRSGGPLDFGRVGVAWLPARPIRRHGKDQVAPDAGALRRLLRAAFERGPLTPRRQSRIAAAAARFSWTACFDTLDERLRAELARVSHPTRRAGRSPAAARRDFGGSAYYFYRAGPTSWRYQSARVDAVLRRRSTAHRSSPFARPCPASGVRLVVGQSGFCLEAFLESRGTPGARRIVHRESAPLEVVTPLVDEERVRCGLPPMGAPPIALWRDRRECELADTIVVTSRHSRTLFIGAGHPAAKLRVIAPGIARAERHRRPSRGSFRLLFVASDPFRKGLRILLDAWRRVRYPRAELWLVASVEALASPLVLSHLVRDPRISFRAFTVQRAFLPIYEQVDALVLPSLEEGFPAAIADGMARGKPAIVSTSSGITDVLDHDHNGLVVETNAVEALADAVAALAGNPGRVRRLGDAAHETARQLPWSLFERRFEALLAEHEPP